MSKSPDTENISSRAREHVHYTPRQTAPRHKGQRQQDLSLGGQIDQTEPQLWKPCSSFLTQFMPVNNQTHDVHQAAAVALVKDKQDLQPLVLCLGSDNKDFFSSSYLVFNTSWYRWLNPRNPPLNLFFSDSWPHMSQFWPSHFLTQELLWKFFILVA